MVENVLHNFIIARLPDRPSTYFLAIHLKQNVYRNHLKNQIKNMAKSFANMQAHKISHIPVKQCNGANFTFYMSQ